MRADKVLLAVVHVFDVLLQVALLAKLLLADLAFVRLQAQIYGVVVSSQRPRRGECRIALEAVVKRGHFSLSKRFCKVTDPFFLSLLSLACEHFVSLACLVCELDFVRISLCLFSCSSTRLAEP